MKKFTVLASILLASASLLAAQERINPPDRGFALRERLAKTLNLTEEQQKNIESLRFEMRKALVEQQARLKTSRLELAELFKADQPNQAAIQKKVGEISQLQSQQRLLRVDHWFAVNKLLTPDQQKTWKKESARIMAQAKSRLIRGRAARFMRNPRRLRQYAQPPRATGR